MDAKTNSVAIYLNDLCYVGRQDDKVSRHVRAHITLVTPCTTNTHTLYLQCTVQFPLKICDKGKAACVFAYIWTLARY